MLPGPANRVVGAVAVLVVATVGATPAHGSAHRLVRHSLARRISTHWAGYVDSAAATSFTAVQATWVEPRIRCNRPNSSAAFWIGLGGATATATGLEQIGTSADCSESLLPSYSAWYEFLPAHAAPIELPVAIAPGDAVTARLDAHDTTVSLSVRNLTTGESFSTRATLPHLDRSSAEWIAEAPSACFFGCTTLPLATFGSITFKSASAVSGAHAGTIDDSGWSHKQVELVTTTGRSIAVPSHLSPDGGSFSVLCRHHPRR